ncbi:MAG: hypothetical protein QG672_1525 [Pseudomonadota bacterium]|nr:hypothetical protein [Pseudomonadota bacterium]MDQ5945573.1 hypothetical protein [Pseudomonadota bacterium]
MSKGTLSILCADITGGDKLFEKLVPSEAAHALGRYEKRIAQTVEGFHGRLAKGAGSKVLAFFSEAEDALQTAIEIQRRISNLPPMSGVSLGIRVGVCVGHASNEMRFFDNNANNAAVSLSDFAAPGQVLISVPKRAVGFDWNEREAHSRTDVSLASGKRQLGVFEIDWRTFCAGNLKAANFSVAPVDRLFIHFKGETLEVNAERPRVSIGRLSSCGVHLSSERCSRVHAKIERRGDTFVLIDQSTNGTFVTPEGGSEHALHKHELALSGRGRICFGESFSVTGVECLDYAIGEGFRR